ncbi:MAG: DNA polymerase III subunit chi [Burkholderiales bacterium]|nr:DNA polymerase III subunit chi [Burkholderiales bacterium]
MTQIDFYTNVPDRALTACTLASKALARGLRMMILTTDQGATQRLDALLWTQPSTGFLPHCRAHHRLAAVTPIILDHVAEPVIHEQILLNLRDELPPHFSRFERLIELVGADETGREQARARFRFYRDRGYGIRTHDLARNAGQ